MPEVHGTSGATVLLVAHCTTATPRLLDEVRRRARQGPCRSLGLPVALAIAERRRAPTGAKGVS